VKERSDHNNGERVIENNVAIHYNGNTINMIELEKLRKRRKLMNE